MFGRESGRPRGTVHERRTCFTSTDVDVSTEARVFHCFEHRCIEPISAPSSDPIEQFGRYNGEAEPAE